MAFKQLITPNLDDNPKKPLYIYVDGKICTNWVGWCLAVCKAAFGATKSMGTALNAWNANSTKHTNYDLPEGVYCLIWWNGGYSDGKELGHVAIAKRSGSQVKIWSSPYKKSATFTTFSGEIKSTINSLISKYRLKSYLGWTETICEKRVIEEIIEKKPTPTKSNEEICKEVWEGKWGTGKDREKRLTEAGYDYATIQSMIDAGVGKPTASKPADEPKVEEPKEDTTNTPEPASEPPSEPTEPQTEEATNNNNEQKEKPMAEPAKGQDTNFIGEIVEEASDCFNPSNKVKLIAYLVGDLCLGIAILLPDIVNTIQAPNLSVWAEYLSKVFLEGGTFVLLVFKLIKKKR